MPTRYFPVRGVLQSLALAALLLLGRVPHVRADPGEFHVAPGGNCGSVANCFGSVQAAVDAAAPGDEIRVATGTYTDISVRPRCDTEATGVVTQTVYISKTVTIRGGYSAGYALCDPDTYPSTLDARGHGRGLYITGAISPTIEGLRITGGNAVGLGGYSYYGQYDVGGGVYVMTATVTLSSNQVFSNTAPYGGGGVFLQDSVSHIDVNAISSNGVGVGGGGLFLYECAASLRGNLIESNTAGHMGGGVYLFSSDARLYGNTIAHNTATTYGGGLDVASCDPTLSGNVISDNAADSGGGVYLWYSRSLLSNNVIMDNRAVHAGSGLRIRGSRPRLLHTTIARNTGGDGSGISVEDDGSGLGSTVEMHNSALVGHVVGITVAAGSTATLDGVLWHGNGINGGGAGALTVTHAASGAPAFASDGYHLSAGSAAIDRGVPAGILTDIDGQPRFGVPDLGADEYWLPGYPKVISLPMIVRGV